MLADDERFTLARNLGEALGKLAERNAQRALCPSRLVLPRLAYIYQQRLAARSLVAWAADEQTWLDANIADSCYEPAWQSWKSGVTDISTAADSLRALAEAASPGTDAQGQAAGAKLASGGDALKTAADLATQARAACRG